MAKDFKYVRYADSTRVHCSYNPDSAGIVEVLKDKEGAELYKKQVIRDLKKLLKPGDTVFTVLRHVSSSGMRREISLVIPGKGKRAGDLIRLDWYMSEISASYNKIGKNGGLIVGGCGMDMGFHLVYTLGSLLWPKGTPKPHGSRNGEPDSDGGYALKHQWL